MEKIIKHFGTPRHSGRYPWGSGGAPEQRNKSFRGQVNELKKKGLSEAEIAKGFGLKNSSELRKKISIEKDSETRQLQQRAMELRDKGYSPTKIGEIMGRNESSVRGFLNPVLQKRAETTRNIANVLKEEVDKNKYVDVGLGVEIHVGVSRTRLKTSISMLEKEGYRVHKFSTDQMGTGKKTNMMVLTKSDVEYPEVIKNKDKIKLINHHMSEDGKTLLGLEPPRNIESSRIKIRYKEDGGEEKDGVIELRRGVPELSLGAKRYAQVRIAVDGTHFLKGMAMYADDMPKGIDIVYNSNKSKNTPKEKVFKQMETDKDNPFGSTIRQKHYIDSNGKKQLSALNIVGSKEGAGEEGSWNKWSKNLSSQVLSKQSTTLAKKQLGLAYDIKKEEYNEIMRLTNPVIKKKLLQEFADNCDSSAVHLKAAALPRQASHVILPIPSMKDTEVYAPNYRNGERVVLIRHPHGGIFEIPELTVNNRNPIAKKILGAAEDAIGIHPNVAARLSGADFDGDTVLVIPNKNKLIRTDSARKNLIEFNPRETYGDFAGPYIKPKTKQLKMGDISNLITDMTIKGADMNEIERAVRHSMVVIDAEKHKLDYKRSYNDHGIADLKRRYQGGARKGASTLISKASSQARIPYREEGAKIGPISPKTGKRQRVYIDPVTGKKLYETPNKSYINKDGKRIIKLTKTTKMDITDDAFTLSSGMPIETEYATHANKLKALANKARKDYLATPPMKMSPSAKVTYANEVASLKSKLNVALKNKPLERQAQLFADKVVATKKANNPDMDYEDIKKIKDQALTEARIRMGAGKEAIPITTREWEAIQSGAISNNVLTQIIDNTKPELVKQLATPRTTTTMSKARVTKAQQLLADGYTQSEVADYLGVSTATLLKSLGKE